MENNDGTAKKTATALGLNELPRSVVLWSLVALGVVVVALTAGQNLADLPLWPAWLSE